MPIPPPSERPDLYDDFDGVDRPEGWVSPIKTPPEIQRMLDEQKVEREKSPQASDAPNAREDS